MLPHTSTEARGLPADAPLLVGREAELTRVEAFLDAVSSDSAHSLSIEGEPGVGKSALWRHALALARARGYRTLVARPVENEAALSFAALVDLLEPVLDGTLLRLPEPQRRALEVALLLRPTDGAPDPLALATGFLNSLRALGEGSPVVVAADDTQWLDSASAGILAFAARRVSTEPIVFLLSRRVDEAGADDALYEAFGDRLERLVPSPLSLGSLHRLLAARFGHPFSRPIVRRLREISGGNPYFTLELGHALETEPTVGSAVHDLPLPNTLRDVVRRRIAVLPDDERRLLLSIAALPQPTLELLGKVAGRSVDESSLAGAISMQVVVLDAGRIRFTHPLLGSVVYADAGDAGRKKLHRLLAKLVPGDEESARHLALATEHPDAKVAARLDDAARKLRARGALDRAADLFARAIALAPADDPLTHGRLLAAADCWTDAGDASHAIPSLDRAIDESRSGTERAEALTRLAWIRCRNTGYREGCVLFERAAAEAATEPVVLIAIEKGLAWTDQMLGDLGAAETHARHASDLAHEVPEAGLAAEALADLAFIEMLRGRRGFRRSMQRALALERSRGSRPGGSRWVDVRARWLHALVLAWTDQLDASRSALLRLQSEAVESGHEHVLPYLSNWLGRVACYAGSWQEGLAHALDANDASAHAGLEVERPYALSTVALAEAHLGDVASASAAIDEGLQLARAMEVVPAQLELLAVKGFLELSMAGPPEAYTTLVDLARRASEAGFAQPAVQRFHPDLIEASVAVGDRETANRCLDELNECARTLRSPWSRTVAARGAGIVTAAAGDLSTAIGHLELALAEHARLANGFEHGRTLLQHGIVLRRLKRKRDSRTSLTTALSIFQHAGAPLWAERAEAELARISGSSPRERTELSETERRIAALVVLGKANKEIAAELHVAVRTVESNLTRVYRKLGIRSRAQLIALMHGVQ